ncbi:MAG: hypothetical protein ACW98F_17460, partial [Candidatus Hodarchaeales archaeon]
MRDLKKTKKAAKTILLIWITVYLTLSPQPVNAEVTADWGDIVDVYYLRFSNSNYTEIAEENNLFYVYLSPTSTVPTHLRTLFPEASAGYIQSFKEGIVGLSVNEERQFTSINPYGDGKDFYFQVKLLKIHYDASENVETPTVLVATLDLIGNYSDGGYAYDIFMQEDLVFIAEESLASKGGGL